jgi:hypothetical protein
MVEQQSPETRAEHDGELNRPTMRPPPLSGSSLMPLDSQVDQTTGMAEFSVPNTIIMAATPQSEWPGKLLIRRMSANRAFW